MKPELKQIFKGKSVAIAGFGVEGHAAYQFLQAIGNCQVTIIDQNTEVEVPESTAAKLGSDWLESLGSYDVVLRTSGMHPDKLSGAQRVRTSTDLLLEVYGQQTIGVTGTKGKSTTASLLTAVLESAGQQVELVGNIGRSAWEILATDISPETVVVAELSSFQLSDAVHSPHGAILLPIVSDHLDWHGSQEHYIQSKLNLISHQSESDWLVTSKKSAENLNVADKTSSKILITDDLIPQNNDNLIIDYGTISLNDIALPGQHNVDNIKLALTAALQWLEEYDPATSKRWEDIRDTICQFQPLTYHLQNIGTIDGRAVINDSYSSTPIATVAAIESTSGPKTLLFGGQSRGLDLRPTIAAFDSNQVQQVIIIGADEAYCQEIAELVEKGSKTQPIVVGEQDMGAIVDKALDVSGERTTILFSPGHPSFDMYTNFNQRGKLFTEAVKSARADDA